MPKMQRWQRTAAAHLKRQAPRAPDVVWIFSSGTQAVGRVKAIGLSFDAILESARSVNSHLQAGPKDIWSVEIPDYHVGGFSIYARAKLSRSKVVKGGQWAPARTVKKWQERNVTLTSLVPTQVFDLVTHSLRAPKSLRAAVIGGGPLDPSLYLRARELGWPLLPSYGLTECASQVATAPLDSLGRKEFPGLTVLPHARVDFYLQRLRVQCLSACRWIATATEDGSFTLEDPLRDGWFATEDLGEWKGVPISGRPQQIRVLGRQDEVVKVYGVLVPLPQVESDLRKFCQEAQGVWTVVALGGGREGARIIVVAEDPAGKETLELGVRKYNAGVTGPYRVHEVKTARIPRTSLGKIKRAELAESLK
jgi:O-succinylbenzoic acid--CoA ligase